MVEKTQDNTTFIINDTARPNSFEMGPSGKRFKLYFDSVEDLGKLLDDLKKKGLYNEE